MAQSDRPSRDAAARRPARPSPRRATYAVLAGVCLAGLVGLTGCDRDSDSDPPENDAAVRRLLGPLGEDPAAAGRLLTGRATHQLEDEADAAGLPDEGRVVWLVDDRGFSDATEDAVGASLRAAAGPVTGATDESVAAALVDAGTLDSRLHVAVAEVLAARPDELLASARRGAPWSADALADLLPRLGADEASRAAVSTAVLGTAEERLRAADVDTGLLAAHVAVPAGWLLGVLDSGAADGLSEADARALVDDRRLELETVAEDALVAAGRPRSAAQSMSATISRGYSDGLAAAD